VTAFGIIKIGLDPVLVRIGSVAVHWYGLMYVVGIVAGLFVALPYAEKQGISRERAYEVFWPVVVASLVGGRLYYVAQSNIGDYLRHPQDILATWEGGMAFYGAVFLGTATALFVCLRRGISFPVAMDAAALFIPLAQAFGRVGNIINGDIVGYASNLPWATEYTNRANTFVPSHSVAYDPAAAYELLFSLALFGLIWALRSRLRPSGTLFAVWLVTYSVGQFALFFARNNPVVLLELKQAQLTAIVVVAVAVPVWLLWRRHSLTLAEQQRGSPLVEDPPKAESLPATASD
jgi:phosphatidylglycerol:prolipoprotein diacylglycerol transferase